MQVWLSGVRNQSHLIYAASWLRTVAGPVEVNIIDAGGFLANGTVTIAQFERWLGSIENLTIKQPDRIVFTEREQTYLAIGNPGIKPLIALRKARPFGRLNIVVVDEGIGSYGTFTTFQAAARRQGNSLGVATARAAAAQAARACTTLRWPLYVRSGDTWTVNHSVAKEFLRATPNPSNKVFYLSQPWPLLGVASVAEYSAHLQEVAQAVRACGADFVVKPHPMEDPAWFDAIDVPIYQGDIPADVDPEIIGAMAILGTNSTGLLNLAAVHQRPAWRLDFAALQAIDDGMSAGQASLFDTFLNEVRQISDLAGLLAGDTR